ncbi:binary toxin-like calcium binding domain-containing protein [Bacillus cereus]|uniref:binary toxin-like calcium binding domain-containing protein n=1 Tax=Bacillus cereus TaxID=1396 RepID=UPI000BF4F70D|nr:binary toxin-like calcium binding domain-containing protein [Bacillus cereus]PEQ64671.1 hypothetical protein CN469_13425 [Bacillus cereus]
MKKKKLKPALSLLGSASMALTLAAPTFAETSQSTSVSTVEVFQADSNMDPKDSNAMYGPNGEIGKLVTMKMESENTDWDKDGISNDLEKKGYKIEFNRQTGKYEAKAWDSQKDAREARFISNPMSANTDGDPFADMYEVENYNSNSDTDFNPIIANIPNLQVNLKSITVTPIATITDNNGGSISRGWEKSVATQHSFDVGLTGTAGVEGPVPTASGSLSVAYGYSHTTTETESFTRNFDWSTATTVNTARAAKVRVQLEYKNVGTASAENVSPHFNIRLGNKIINTVKATQDRYKVPYLSTEKGNLNKVEVAIDSLDTQADADIVLSLDELKAFEQGQLLSVEVLPTGSMDLSIEKDGSFRNLGDAGRYQSRVNASTIQLETDIGNKPKFQVYTPKDSFNDDGHLTYNQILKQVGIDTGKINHFVNVNKSNKYRTIVSSGTQEFESYANWRNGDPNRRTNVSTDWNYGAFATLQPSTLVDSSYDPATQKIRASISPGLLGTSNEIKAIYKDKKGFTKTATLTKSADGYVYESNENIHFVDFSPSDMVTFEFNDPQNVRPTQTTATLVKYNNKYDDYVTDINGDFIVEGTPYTIEKDSSYWGSHHANNNWEYLWSEKSSSEKVNLIIERIRQAKPGQPIKKDEEVYIKFEKPIYSDHAYLKLEDGYIHLDKHQNASTFTFSKIGSQNSYKDWKIKSNGQDIGINGTVDYVKYGTSTFDNWNLVKTQ